MSYTRVSYLLNGIVAINSAGNNIGAIGLGTTASLTNLLNLGVTTGQRAISIIQVSGETSGVNLIDIATTWNNAANTPTAFKLSVTDISSNVASILFDIQKSGTSIFNVSKLGALSIASSIKIGNAGTGAITIGDATTSNSGASLILYGYHTGQTNWQIDVGISGTGLSLTPSTVFGGLTFTSPAFTISSSGNVGIGVNGANDRLEVSGILKVIAIAGSASYVRFDESNNSGDTWRVGTNINSLNWLSLYDQTTNTFALNCFGNGNVNIPNVANGVVNADSSGTLYSTSDERLKIIEGDFSVGLSALLKIQPKRFRWTTESGLNTLDINYAFIAQNVQSAVAEAVGLNKNGFLTLQDRTLLAVAINAIKELDAKITILSEKR